MEMLDFLANRLYVFKVAPHSGTVDISPGRIPYVFPTTNLSPYNALHDHLRGSGESTDFPESSET